MARTLGGGAETRRAAAARLVAAAVLVAAALLTAAAAAWAGENPVRSVRIVTPDQLRITLDRTPERLDPANYRFTEAASPDVPIEIKAVRSEPGNVVVLTTGQSLHPQQAYRIDVKDPAGGRDVAPSRWALTLMAIISAALINNFVFTRYLGLCIFFGVSKKRDTAVGMGATFTMVMLTTGMMSWVLYTFVMKPLQLRFLQVLVFIGVVAFMVQLLDTVLKKVNRKLHQSFGVYLVLITTNCIILAVPLLNAASDAGPLEAFALAMGSGFGFALAMFLMSCAREKMELARVPASFQGLPIAFALAGLFALAFMGFSGLNFFR